MVFRVLTVFVLGVLVGMAGCGTLTPAGQLLPVTDELRATCPSVNDDGIAGLISVSMESRALGLTRYTSLGINAAGCDAEASDAHMLECLICGAAVVNYVYDN